MTDVPTHFQDPRGTPEAAADASRYGAGMRSYWYAWGPFALLFATVVVMVIPYLAVVVLLGIVLVAATALVRLTRAIAGALYARVNGGASDDLPATEPRRAL